MQRPLRIANPLSAVLIAVVLVACSASGLAAGVYARHLGDPLVMATATNQSAPSQSPSRSPRPAATATSAPQTTATPPRPAVAVAFVLSVSVSPATLPPGSALIVTVTARTQHGASPIAGLQCFMRAPTNGRAPLFQDWPTPQVTDDSGRATWQLTTPQLAPGPYGIEVVAYGANSYSYYADSFVTVSS